jgi:hypothetical protein
LIDPFEIIDHGSTRPEADRLIFCDGAGGELSAARRCKLLSSRSRYRRS